MNLLIEDAYLAGRGRRSEPAVAAVVRPFDRYDASLILGLSLYLCINLFTTHATPLLLGGDQLYFWMDGQRLLHGEQVYRDFFQNSPPGTDLIYFSVFKLFGPRIWTTNLVVLAVGIALCWLCLRLSRLLMRRSQAALATSLFLVCLYGRMLIGTHHWFSLLCVLGAVIILMEGGTPARIATAGALLGVATFFTQTRGPAAALGIAAWITWNRFRTDQPWPVFLRNQVLLFAPMVATWTVLSSYYIATLGLSRLWFFQAAYVRENMLSKWYAPLLRVSHELSWTTLPVVMQSLVAYVVLPPVYAICLWKSYRAPREATPDSTARVALLTLVGTAMFLEICQNPSWLRFYCVAVPAVVLLAWLVSGSGKFARYATRLLWIGVIGLAVHQTGAMQRAYSVVEDLPAGRIAVTPSAAEKLEWFAARTEPGQFLLQAGWPGLYLPLGLRNPLFIEELETAGQGRLGYVTLSIRQVEARQVRYIVWSPRLDSPDFALGPFRDFMLKRYRRIWTFSDQDEVWERTPEGPARASQGSAEAATPTALKVVNGSAASLTEKDRAALTETADALYDLANAGWGTEHKYIDASAIEWSFATLDAGNQLAMTKVRRTLDANQSLIDPVWGGVFQYSDQVDWTSPHYEKLLSNQADDLRIYSEAYSRWHREADLEAAQKLYSYLTTFLSAPDGGFYVSQDADVSAKMTGQEFYPKDDAARRAAGMPKIDVHEYSRETGWAVRALCKYYDVTGNAAALTRAERGAKWALSARQIAGGGFRHGATGSTAGGVKDAGHDAKRTAGRTSTDAASDGRANASGDAGRAAEDTTPAAGPFLDDNISMTQAFLALYRSTGNREWLKAAVATLDFIDTKLRDPRAGYVASTPISSTRGVFREPVRDVAQNAAVVRTASMLHHYAAAERHLRIARHAMKYLSGFAAAASDQFRPGILLADHELSAAPIHITIVGDKDNPAAQSLHAAALQYPTDYLQVDWWDRREGKLPDPSITYPDLKRPAAFACTANACSTPVYEASEIQERVRSVLN